MEEEVENEEHKLYKLKLKMCKKKNFEIEEGETEAL